MTSARLRVNRQNAQLRTGPRTQAGERRSSKNALHHGLSIPIGLDKSLEPKIEEMARAIAGENAAIGVLDYARVIAEAEFDVLRVREAKYALFSNPIERIAPLSDRREVRACIDFLEG